MSALFQRARCRVPNLDRDGLVIDEFEIEPGDWQNLRNAVKHNRGSAPGTYKRLTVDHTLWMSDVDAEIRDLAVAVFAADRHKGGTGLINGLGLGCVLGAWLDVLDHVDVVELDQRIVDTVGVWFVETFSPERVTIYRDDAMTIRWPVGKRWDVVWHDIWPMIGADNLPQMVRLHRRYGGRCDWQGSWAEDEAKDMRREEAMWDRIYRR